MTPGAWYDLSARLGEIKAVAGAIAGALPAGGIPLALMGAISNAHALADAAVDLVEIAERDLERLETELAAATP